MSNTPAPQPTNTSTQLSTSVITARKIDLAVSELITQSKDLGAFEKALKKTEIIALISESLDTSGAMVSVMKMQGKQYGFKTDSKSPEGYNQEIVKNCLIEATLRGVEPTGNMFNILGGNCYITKEGCKHILNRMEIARKIECGLSKKTDTGLRVIPCNISWFDVRENVEKKKYLEVQVAYYEGVTKEPTMKGMAERDAMAWLIEELTGTPMPIGEVEVRTEDASHVVVSSEVAGSSAASVEFKEMATPEQQKKFDTYISKAVSIEDLDKRANAAAGQISKTLEFFDLTVYNETKTKF